MTQDRASGCVCASLPRDRRASQHPASDYTLNCEEPDIAARLAPHDPPSARAKTLSVFAMMVGTLQLSRALADPQLADQVLDQGIHNALALLGAEQQR